MLIVKPDFDRRIDLPGVGPCRRPIDIDQARSGLSQLVSLRVYSFDEHMVIDGEAEDDEVFIVLMRGRADIGVTHTDGATRNFELRTAGGSRVVYLPPHASYRLTAITDCDIAYARARPSAAALPAPHDFVPKDGRLAIADYASGMRLLFASMPAGSTIDGADGGYGAPERFAHLRFERDGDASLSGWPLGDWESGVIEQGEDATLVVDTGHADILMISATRGGAALAS